MRLPSPADPVHSSAHLIRPLDQPGDLGWALMANGLAFAAEPCGHLPYESLIAAFIAEHVASSDDSIGSAWIAELDGQRVGTVFCMTGAGRATPILRPLVVSPEARGRGIGRALVETCVEHARQHGASRLDLWTTSTLTAAARLFSSAGFRLLAHEPDARFGPAVQSEWWGMSLATH